MSKTLTEQWKDGELEKGTYWCISSWTEEIRIFYFEGDYFIDCDVPLDDDNIEEVLAPVPSYRALYGPNDGNMTTGVFTVLKIIKENIENAQKQRRLTDLECGIKSQVVSLLKKWGVE